MQTKLLKFIPPHKVYVEVFGGGASLLFAKEPADVEIYNDINSGLVNFFRVLRDEEKFKEFYRKVFLTPWSREEFNFCQKNRNDCQDDIERAYRFFVSVRMSFSGTIEGGWARSLYNTNNKMAGHTSQWIGLIKKLPEIHCRIMSVQIEHCDFRKLINLYDTDKTFMYLDPPYIHETRNTTDLYKNEMDNKDHEDLVSLILSGKSKFLLSGYNHPIYKPLEDAGWQRIDFKTSCWAVGRTKSSKILGKGAALEKAARTESVWLSPNLIKGLKTKDLPLLETRECQL